MKYKPDIIISVHPLMQHIPLWVLKWQGLQKKVIFVTVITDLDTCHPTWSVNEIVIYEMLFSFIVVWSHLIQNWNYYYLGFTLGLIDAIAPQRRWPSGLYWMAWKSLKFACLACPSGHPSAAQSSLRWEFIRLFELKWSSFFLVLPAWPSYVERRALILFVLTFLFDSRMSWE